MKVIKKNISAKDGSGSVMLRPENAGEFVVRRVDIVILTLLPSK